MTDPKDELRARFDEQTHADDDEDEAAEEGQTDSSGQASNSGDSNNSSNTGNSNDAGNVSDSNNSNTTEATPNTDTAADDPTTEASTPGPEKDTTATRHRRQVPMYLPEAKATALNQLYERLDGRSKVAGEGGIEKHADFMEQLVAFAIEHEDELATELDIQQ